MFKKTVHELFRCKGSRLFVILMLVNFALSCIMPALNGGFVDFLVTNRDHLASYGLRPLLRA